MSCFYFDICNSVILEVRDRFFFREWGLWDGGGEDIFVLLVMSK